ncbi:SSU0592/SSU0593 family protein [Streptococcus suis]|uniref:SSU0592/SSU0593 family protein n=1 Tax=Streptococcus suis TaxID=1307 RepID=UPI001CF26DAC|nr:hypothetical protein [Streptococcus suis]MCB2862915.1 hypothetical protein [Streptococcus suis]MCB2889384.1 hypothetical protein [Streptococcus suis]
MKHIVTKRNYKVGACAMALALLMTTAGGAVVNAEQHLESSVGLVQRGDVLLKLKESNQSFNEGEVGNLEPANPTVPPMASSVQKSWFSSFWGGVKTFWNALCCSVGLTGLKVSK